MVDDTDLKSVESNSRESSSLSSATNTGQSPSLVKAVAFEAAREEVPPSLVRIQPAQLKISERIYLELFKDLVYLNRKI